LAVLIVDARLHQVVVDAQTFDLLDEDLVLVESLTCLPGDLIDLRLVASRLLEPIQLSVDQRVHVLARRRHGNQRPEKHARQRNCATRFPFHVHLVRWPEKQTSPRELASAFPRQIHVTAYPPPRYVTDVVALSVPSQDDVDSLPPRSWI